MAAKLVKLYKKVLVDVDGKTEAKLEMCKAEEFQVDVMCQNGWSEDKAEAEKVTKAALEKEAKED